MKRPKVKIERKDGKVVEVDERVADSMIARDKAKLAANATPPRPQRRAPKRPDDADK